MTRGFDVVVVGSGPNGLASAVVCAAAGLSVHVLEAQSQPGGGCRTEELDLGTPLRHDLCSAVHPMAVASPFFQRFKLPQRVRFGVPTVSYAHPFEDGPAGIAYRDLDRTADELNEIDPSEARLWRRVMAPLVDSVEVVRDIGLSDMRSLPAGLFTPKGVLGAGAMAGRAVELGTSLWDRVTDTEYAGAMLTGIGAHANTALPSFAAAGTALLLGTLAHSHGWPIPIGGAQAIIDALIDDLRARGATVACGRAVMSAADLPPARVYMFDTAPGALADVFGDQLSARYRRSLRRFGPGNGVAKVDFALSGPVPWADARIADAGTVHIGGTRAQMTHAEADTTAGRHSPTPVILLSQPTVADETRFGSGGSLPLWTYAHVPNGSTRDMTETITARIERFAPGFRDVVIGSRCIPASEMAHHNANYVGGDIAAGRVSLFRMAARPMAKWNPYRTSKDNVYLCSAGTPPGPGVHGMSGLHAASRVLDEQFGIRTMPDLSPSSQPRV
ncbi:MAG: NAD(P)/FAD-dependent oxidoreductase [Aldersonia sp.]|nr:NAD(P)/FAD-dependent oxidoreductase [Aldersonia sp.]